MGLCDGAEHMEDRQFLPIGVNDGSVIGPGQGSTLAGH